MFSANETEPEPPIGLSCGEEPLMENVMKFAKKMFSIGIMVWIGSYLFVTCLNLAAERQVSIKFYESDL